MCIHTPHPHYFDSQDGWTPLHWAGAKGHHVVCTALADAGAAKGHAEVCTALVKAGAAVDAKDTVRVGRALLPAAGSHVRVGG